MKDGCLFLFHTGSNAGYAIARLEAMFYRTALELLAGDASRIHFGHASMSRGRPNSLPEGFENFVCYDYLTDGDRRSLHSLTGYVRRHRIRLVVALDIQPIHPVFASLREAGARTILAYWGAAISSRMPRWKLALKQFQFSTSRSKVDGLIFESKAMADLAIYGRGVPPALVDVVPLGVDPALFKPGPSNYAYERFAFPRDRKIVVYGGHMEPRKGVRTLVEAAIELLGRRKRTDLCFLLCGNRTGESSQYQRMYADRPLNQLIQFGGYRKDLANIYPGCFCGVIPSTGWDSFTYSSLELAASGLPVIASRLQGLPEAVLERQTGLLFEPGNAGALADCIEALADDPELAAKYGRAGRERCKNELSLKNQGRGLLEVVRKRLELAAH